MVDILAAAIIPMIFLTALIAGLIKGKPIYDIFTKGAKSGVDMALSLIPTLVGLLIGASVLRESGILEALGSFLGKYTEKAGMPTDVLWVSLMKIFSSSAATGLMLDIFKTQGADSYAGNLAALILSSTETIMYTVSVYYMSVKITKTGFTIPGAIVSMIAGIVASVVIAGMM